MKVRVLNRVFASLVVAFVIGLGTIIAMLAKFPEAATVVIFVDESPQSQEAEDVAIDKNTADIKRLKKVIGIRAN